MLDWEKVSDKFFLAQEEDYDCGLFVFMYALGMFNFGQIDKQQILADLKVCPEAGTHHKVMEESFIRRGIPIRSTYGASIAQLVDGFTNGQVGIITYQSVSEGDEMITEHTARWNESKVPKVSRRLPDSGHLCMPFDHFVDENNEGYTVILDPGIFYAVNSLPRGIRVIKDTIIESRWFDVEGDNTWADHWLLLIPWLTMKEYTM